MGFGMARTMISNALPRAYCSGSRFAAATPRFRIRYRASLPRKPGPRTEKSPDCPLCLLGTAPQSTRTPLWLPRQAPLSYLVRESILSPQI